MKSKLLLCFAIFSFCNLGGVSAQTRTEFKGSFTNVTLTESGTVTMSLIHSLPDSISGYINFTQLKGNSPLCGAGNYTGKIVGDSLFMSFSSHDTDQSCGFDHGWQFTLRARRFAEIDSIAGMYQIGNVNAESGIFTLTAPPVTTTVARIDETQAGLYPNPSTGTFSISLPGHIVAATATITDQVGSRVGVRQLRAGQTKLDLDLPSGVYFVQVESGSWRSSRKLVIRR